MSEAPRVLALTGTRAGLGRGLADHFLDRGWIVEGCSRGEASIVHERYGHQQLDVAQERAVHAWVRGLARKRGGLDAAVANAAYIPAPAPVAGSDGRALAQALSVNVGGSTSLLSAASRVMLRQGRGSLVAISSMATAVLQPGTAAYVASKAALEAWVKVLAKELAPAGINCNVVAPSIVDTEGLQQLGASGRAQAMAQLAVPRALSPAEVGAAIELLLSSEAQTITGQIVYLGLVT